MSCISLPNLDAPIYSSPIIKNPAPAEADAGEPPKEEHCMMKLGFFALRHCADSADRVVAPAGAPQDGCLGWAGRFINFRHFGQVTLPGTLVFNLIAPPGFRQAMNNWAFMK